MHTRSEASALIDLFVLVAFAMTLMLLAACGRDEDRASPTPVQNMEKDDLDSAQDVVDAYEEARNARDVGRVTSLLVQRLADEGEQAVSEGWDEIRSTKFEVLSVEDRGEDKMWVVGRYDVELEDGTTRSEDYWVFPLYKENGQWKIDPDGAQQATDEWMKANKKGPYADGSN